MLHIKSITHRNIILLIILIIYIITRMIFLDSDLPAWAITMYQPIDEFYYTITGFNLFHYGAFTHTVINFIPDDGTPANLLQSIMTFLSLKIFGNNYYGLRAASVIAGLLIVIIMYVILTKIDIINKNNSSSAKYIFISFLLFDFSFIMAARVAEPTIFRMLAMVFCILVFIYKDKFHKYQYLFEGVFGFISLSSILYVYAYNAFILPACFITVIITSNKKNNIGDSIKSILSFISGAIISLISYYLFCDIVYDKGLIQVLKELMTGQSSRVSSTINKFIYNFINIFTTNIFRFNLTLLFIFLICIPIFALMVIKFRKENQILIANLTLFLVIQTIFVNDYSYRKLIIFLPLVLIIIYESYFFIRKSMIKLMESKINKVFFCIYFLMSFIFTFKIYKKELNAFNNIFKYINFFCLLFTIIFIFAAYHYRLNNSFLKLLIVVLVLLPVFAMDYNYIYSNPTYLYRDSMKDVSIYINDKIVIGGLSYGMRLYNTSVPVLNPYKYYNNTDSYNNMFEKAKNMNLSDYTVLYTNNPITNNYKIINKYKISADEDVNLGVYNIN